MNKKDLSLLSNDELQIEAKKRKSAYTLFKFFIGLIIGTAIFTTYNKGFSFFTFFPLFFLPLAFSTRSSYNECNEEIESRKL